MKKFRLLSWLFVAIFALVGSNAFAQTKVRGTVVDEQGLPIMGAGVMASQNVGTVTDIDGNFELTVKDSDKFVEVSYLGYETVQVAVAPVMNIQLQPDSEFLDETIVVAYGTTKKSSFTGSASVVKSDALKK
ncbi:MAG: carboxypeptidase-like regulatory domain-containing protein, partial [Kiritimatiellae bacterium]|nr:carboxypeptidase-like regulatory domain-containing protein [Kiritimatiellia bacterium]